MRKYLYTHLIFLIVVFAVVTLIKRWFSLGYLAFWAGGILGTFLPFLDQLVYVFFLRPQDLDSLRVREILAKKQVYKAIEFIFATSKERDNLIFHTAFMQIFFLIFAFWVVSSSGNLFGKGLVVGLVLSLSTDQFRDLLEKGQINSWFSDFKISLSREKALFYWLLTFLFVLYLAFMA